MAVTMPIVLYGPVFAESELLHGSFLHCTESSTSSIHMGNRFRERHIFYL